MIRERHIQTGSLRLLRQKLKEAGVKKAKVNDKGTLTSYMGFKVIERTDLPLHTCLLVDEHGKVLQAFNIK